MGAHYLIQHDWLTGVPKELEALEPDLIIADPPYNIGVRYSEDPTKDRLPPDEYYDKLVLQPISWAGWCLRTGGALAWICSAAHGSMIWEALLREGFHIVNNAPVIWYETFAQYQQTRLTQDYRFVFLAYSDGGPRTFNPDAIRVRSKRQEMGDKRADPRGRVPGMVWQLRRLQGTSVDRVDWHPAQLSPELVSRLILGWSNVGDTVADLFAGSGNAAKVCKATGRRFVGVERSAEYLNKIREILT